MSFTSLQFPFFLALVLAGLALLKPGIRWVWLVAASCWFYMAFIPAYILILFLLIGIDYTAGLFIEASHGKKRAWWLWTSLAANVGLLASFKYLNFILENSSHLLSHLGADAIAWRFPWALPIGLSFHTFQSMAYTIEVYYGRQKAERHLGIYALYVLYFPQMVAGPIERPQNLLESFHRPVVMDWNKLAAGFRQIAWGFFKKVVVADRLADTVNAAYAANSKADGGTLLLATWFFAFQIYCDFSGYTDIARGLARCMGYELMLNFNRPYASRSPGEFWRRWHISLSSWFRDYLYIPLGQPERHVPHLSQLPHRLQRFGPLARGGLELHRLGSLARRIPRGLSAPWTGAGGLGHPLEETPAGVRHLPARVLCLGLLPGDQPDPRAGCRADHRQSILAWPIALRPVRDRSPLRHRLAGRAGIGAVPAVPGRRSMAPSSPGLGALERLVRVGRRDHHLREIRE